MNCDQNDMFLNNSLNSEFPTRTLPEPDCCIEFLGLSKRGGDPVDYKTLDYKENHKSIIPSHQFMAKTLDVVSICNNIDNEAWAQVLFPKESKVAQPAAARNIVCVVLKKDGISINDSIEKSITFEKKERKLVKGVDETIFDRKFDSLYKLLDSVEDEYVIVSGKIKANYFKHDRKTKRRSGYRGVSRNGASWQVLMMINSVKTYIGWYDTEEEGALVYDIVSILFKQHKARTNLSYTKRKLLDLLAIYDKDSKHFLGTIPSEFISDLQRAA